MSANIFKTSVAALDTRKCCYTGENTHLSSIKQREGAGFFHLEESLWSSTWGGWIGSCVWLRYRAYHASPGDRNFINMEIFRSFKTNPEIQFIANNLRSPIMREIDDDETHRLVGDGELSQVVSDHLWLHLNLARKRKVSILDHHHWWKVGWKDLWFLFHFCSEFPSQDRNPYCEHDAMGLLSPMLGTQ